MSCQGKQLWRDTSIYGSQASRSNLCGQVGTSWMSQQLAPKPSPGHFRGIPATKFLYVFLGQYDWTTGVLDNGMNGGSSVPYLAGTPGVPLRIGNGQARKRHININFFVRLVTVFTGFVPGTNPVCPWDKSGENRDKPRNSPYSTQWKPDFTGFVPGTSPVCPRDNPGDEGRHRKFMWKKFMCLFRSLNGVGKQGYGNHPPVDDRNPIRKFSIDPLHVPPKPMGQLGLNWLTTAENQREKPTRKFSIDPASSIGTSIADPVFADPVSETPCVPLFSALCWNRLETEGLVDYLTRGRAGDHLHCTVEPSPGHIRCRFMCSFLIGFFPLPRLLNFSSNSPSSWKCWSVLVNNSSQSMSVVTTLTQA